MSRLFCQVSYLPEVTFGISNVFFFYKHTQNIQIVPKIIVYTFIAEHQLFRKIYLTDYAIKSVSIILLIITKRNETKRIHPYTQYINERY